MGGYFDRIDLFDNSFFKVNPAEARVMDPSQRIFLETAVEAIESASLTDEDLKGSKTGVFVGCSINEDNFIDILSKDDSNVALGNQPSVCAYRLSFLYDMRGPTMVIDTACSSSLVAVHQACQSIESGDCEQAIVGGINIRIFPAIREIGNLGIEAFDGRCKTFDEKANGTNIGDGVAAIIIKKKEQAEKDGDYIYAVIKGSAVNSDGNANGITAPNPEAQVSVIQSAWEKSGINPEKINFIETHGTATKLGDPIEVLALTQAFSAFTNKKSFCPLGAVKTNIGHLEATSGLAGLIKAVLALNYQKLPPNIHFTRPNPYIDFANSAVYPASSLIDFRNQTDNLVAGISSFGISGTNCHLVIEEYKRKQMDKVEPNRQLKPLTFLYSVMHDDLLKDHLKKHLNWLDKHPAVSLEDLSYTLAKGRNHYDCRVAFIASSQSDLRHKLSLFINDPFVENEDIYFRVDSLKNASELIQLYLKKTNIQWDAYFREVKGNKIPIPTYTFHRKRHWPKLEIENLNSEEEKIKSLFYKLEWLEESINYSDESLKENLGKIFIFFMHRDERHEAFVRFVENKGVNVFKVYSSNEFSIDKNKCHIVASRTSDYDRLVNLVLDTSEQTLGGVVHLWDYMPVSLDTESWEAVTQSQVHGVFSIFNLIRSLQKRNFSKSWSLVNITSHAQKVNNETDLIDPTRMPVIGINKVASQEMPLVQSLAVDADLDFSIFDLLFNEIFCVTNYPQAVVGYRKQKRYIQTLSRENIDTLPERNVTIREGGVYFIAGGGGYLGIATAQFLAKKRPVNIILVGRKEVSVVESKQRLVFEEIRKSGSTIEYIQGDVTEIHSCQNIIKAIENKWGVINGVFVAIKNISHKRLDDVSYEQFSSNILAKVKGTWLLDHLTKHMPVDFMANFSSISSITGGPTGADCSASNLFLDSFGDWRNDLGRSTITMNYTLIEADDGSLLSDRMSMIPSISKEEFLKCLEICLYKQINFALIADFNVRVMSLVLPFMKIKFHADLFQQFQVGKEKKTVSKKQIKTDMSLDEIVDSLKGIWQEVLGYEIIDQSSSFFEIGGDSISAVKFVHLAKVQLQVHLEIPDLYTYPILIDLAKSIYEKLNNTKETKGLEQLLEDFKTGKIDINQTAAAYEQIH